MLFAHPVETSFNGRRARVVEVLRAKHKVADCDLQNAVLAVVNDDNFPVLNSSRRHPRPQ